MMAGVWDAALCEALQVPRYIFFPSPLTCIYLFQHFKDVKDLRAAAAPKTEIAFFFPGIRNAIADGSDSPGFPPEWDDLFAQIFNSYHLAEGGIVQDLESCTHDPDRWSTRSSNSSKTSVTATV